MEKYQSKYTFVVKFSIDKWDLLGWWRLPEVTLEPSDILFVDRENQVQVWNRGGTVTFRAQKAQEEDKSD